MFRPKRLFLAVILQVGYIEYQPVITKTADGPQGHLVDYMNQAFKDADIVPEWVELSVDRGLFQLQNGQLSLFAILLKTPEREKQIRFSPVPIFEAQSAICSKAGHLHFPLKKPLRIAHFLATVLPKNFQQHQLIAVTPEDATRRMLVMLEKNRADALYYVNPEVLALHLRETGSPLELDCYVFNDISMQVYMAYGKNLPRKTQEKIDASLIKQQAAGDFRAYMQELLKKLDRRRVKINFVSTDVLRVTDF